VVFTVDNASDNGRFMHLIPGQIRLVLDVCIGNRNLSRNPMTLYRH